MKKILFTKEIDIVWLRNNVANDLDFEICPALKINIFPKETFEPKINTATNKFIVSSQNSVQAISDLKLEGEFFVVGKKTAEILAKKGFQVIHFENYASELAEFILKNYEPQSWNFFCGNNRRETLFEKLEPHGHTLHEIVCYESIPMDFRIQSAYDAFAFFSPLAVKTFFANHSVSPNSVIFSIGNTTTEEIMKHTNNKTLTADIPLIERVVEKINDYFLQS